MADTEITTEPNFKILSTGTHATLGVSTPVETPAPPSGPAEPATPEKKAEEAPTTTPAATPGTGEPPKAEAATTGTTTPQDAPAAGGQGTPPPAAQPPKPITQEEALKQLGFDDEFIKLADVYLKDGNIARYATAMNTDYSKMSAEDIMRESIRRKYPDAPADTLDLLYQSEVVGQYNLDTENFPLESAEAKTGRYKLEQEAKRLREQFTQENEQFKLPTRNIDAERTQQQEAELQQRKARQDAFMADPYTKSFFQDKKVVFKDLSLKDESGKVTAVIPDFTMEVDDADEVGQILVNPQAAAKYLADEKGIGKPSVNIPAAIFARNPTKFIQTFINYGKMLGKEEYVEEKHNPPALSGTSGTPAKESLNEAFVNRGQHGKGG